MKWKTKTRVAIKPGTNVGVFVSCIVVKNDVDDRADRNLRLDGVQKPNEFLMTMHVAADNRAVEDVEGGEQRRGAGAACNRASGFRAGPSSAAGLAGCDQGPESGSSRRPESTMAWAGGGRMLRIRLEIDIEPDKCSSDIDKRLPGNRRMTNVFVEATPQIPTTKLVHCAKAWQIHHMVKSAIFKYRDRCRWLCFICDKIYHSSKKVNGVERRLAELRKIPWRNLDNSILFCRVAPD